MVEFQWYNWILFGAQIVFGTIGIGAILHSIPSSSRSHSIQRKLWGWRKREPSPKLLRLFGIEAQNVLQSNHAILWAGCGFNDSILAYMLLRQVLLWGGYTSTILLMLFIQLLSLRWSMNLVIILSILLGVITALHLDQYWLRVYRQLRANYITKEIYAISGQLLYFADSKLHIHTKLRKCIPYSRLLRKDMEILLADWYHDPTIALQRFKQAIGTEEGISFVDTIDALRQHDNEDFYILLRTRLLDYKDTIELAKEGRKETASYVLFVIAGIPILYTFQVFIYPWVQEVNKLLSLMN
ncbi:MAG: hypothetical protein NAG76_11740 [Candidatus Pristimantibacillus lignocellulolyticus]|uniref:Uncharacterized protein n=1 Tax=Candidatus Pristimantibacillus lignocellulolyticus TaxID=2994561 RepID=A0A9J6Z8T5_9BACL|nr:MAG: hypothetical protein NAG76_11740 [Candidatus Pristimantibacillus lignocellulolyticus]